MLRPGKSVSASRLGRTFAEPESPILHVWEETAEGKIKLRGSGEFNTSSTS
jgi:hypothetical protein